MTRAETESQNKMIKEKLFDLAKDPKKVYKVPSEVKEDVPFLNFSSLENAMAQLKDSAEEFQKIYSNGVAIACCKTK